MNPTTVPAPHRIVLEQPYRYALIAAASLALSLWAIWLDPVIDVAGVTEVRAVEHFQSGDWGVALDTSGRPVYALLAAALGGLTGSLPFHVLQVLNAVLHALLAVGFVVLASVLGGGRAAQWIAALMVLLLPSLNDLRADVAGGSGYWALYVWSLGYFLHYAARPEGRDLRPWAAAAGAALLFAAQALVFLIVIPLWRAVRAAGARRGAGFLALAAAVVVVVAYAAWVRALEAVAAGDGSLLHPFEQWLHGWQELGRGLRFKLEGLSGDFLDSFSRGYDGTALLAALLVTAAAGLIGGLGLAYGVVAAYAVPVSKRSLTPGQHYWWSVFAVLCVALLLASATTGFVVEKSEAMVAVLTLLAPAPLALERLGDRSGERGYCRWVLAGLLALIVAAGIPGLALSGDRDHLREAGLWLRANVASRNADLYSSTPVIDYYAGLHGQRPAAAYSWRHAMNTVQRGAWREYDYLALEIAAAKAHREDALMEAIGVEPVEVFASDTGDRVLIFEVR